MTIQTGSAVLTSVSNPTFIPRVGDTIAYANGREFTVEKVVLQYIEPNGMTFKVWVK